MMANSYEVSEDIKRADFFPDICFTAVKFKTSNNILPAPSSPSP